MEGSFNGVVSAKVFRGTEQTQQCTQANLSKAAHQLPSTTNRSRSQLPTGPQISQQTHTPMGSFLKVNLIGKAWFQYGYDSDSAHICSLLAARAVPKSFQDQGLALRVVRIKKLVYTPIGEATVVRALLQPVVLIYNSSGKCTEDLNDLHFKYC